MLLNATKRLTDKHLSRFVAPHSIEVDSHIPTSQSAVASQPVLQASGPIYGEWSSRSNSPKTLRPIPVDHALGRLARGPQDFRSG